MTTVNVTEDKYSVSVTEGVTTVVTVKAPGPQGPGFPDGNLGDVTSSNTGASVVVNSGAITNAKVSASAAIAGTKISPDFGSQNITTTGNAVFGGNLTVSGSVTTIDTTTLRVEDKNIELGKVGSPTDITADGGGITLLGDTNHTFNWLNATDSWTSSEHIALPDNKKLQLGGSQDLKIFHTGSVAKIINNEGDFNIQGNSIRLFNQAGNEFYITCTANAGVDLYYDGTKKAGTSSDGFDIPADSAKLKIGASGDLVFFHDGSNSHIKNNTGDLVLSDTNHVYIRGYTSDKSVGLFFNGSQKVVTSTDGLDLPDNSKLQLGDSQDLKIYHNGVNSFIEDSGTGALALLTSQFVVKNPANTELFINAVENGSVELYHNNVKKAETTSSGVTVSGNLFVSTDGNTSFSLLDTGHGLPASEIKLSNGGRDLNIVAPKDIRLFPQSGELGLVIEANGQVELYHDNAKRFNTTADAVDVHGHLNLGANTDNKRLRFGINNDLQLYHDGSNSFIDNSSGSLYLRPKAGEDGIRVIPDGSVELYHDNVKKAETSADGFDLPDNSKLQLGDSQDLQIFHDGSASVIKDAGTGLLKILGSTVAIKTGNDNETMANFVPNGAVSLFFDNQKKVETSSTGLDVTGAVKASTGILFGSDTADANTLDDYEEGTWTPTVLSEGNIGTPQITCTYTKIGRLVTINADIHQLSDTTSSTFIKIGGLPFVPSGTVSREHSGVCHGERYGGSNIIVAYIIYNSGSYGISFRFGVPTNHYSGVRHSDISDDGSDNNLRFTLTYEIT